MTCSRTGGRVDVGLPAAERLGAGGLNGWQRLTRDTDGLFAPQAWITVLRNDADMASIAEPLATVTTGAGGGHLALAVPPATHIGTLFLNWEPALGVAGSPLRGSGTHDNA